MRKRNGRLVRNRYGGTKENTNLWIGKHTMSRDLIFSFQNQDGNETTVNNLLGEFKIYGIKVGDDFFIYLFIST